jgi:fibronectin-binding autotransporter adhesin
MGVVGTVQRRRASRPALTWSAMAALGTPCLWSQRAGAVQKEFVTGTELSTPTNYSPIGLPGTGDNVVIDNGSFSLSSKNVYTLTNASLDIEDLAFSLNTSSTTISNPTASTTSTIELNGGRGSGYALIEVNSTKNLTFNTSSGSTGALNLILGASGAFDIGTSSNLTINGNIGEANPNTTLTISNTLSGNTGSGTIALNGTNTFSGGLVILGGEVDVAADAGLGATTGTAGGSVTINGGRLGITASGPINAARNIYLGANPSGNNSSGTLSISGGSTVVTFNGVLQDLAGATGDLVKQGHGALVLGGTSTYTGNTFVNYGTIQLATANALPTGTAVSIGQAASTNTGILDLNGWNQQIAGLNSTSSTTSTPTTSNLVANSNASSAAVLTLGGSGTYSYGSSLATNSGLVGNTSSGLLSISKTGIGIQAFGGANTYAGGTTVSGGLLLANAAPAYSGSTLVSSSTGTGTVTISQNGTLAGTGGTGAVTVDGTITAGNGSSAAGSIGTLTTGSQTWGASGTFIDKVASIGTAGTANDLLIMSAVSSVASGFSVSLANTSGASPAFTASNPTPTAATSTPAAGSYIVLAKDTTDGAGSPFNNATTLASLNLSFSANGVATFGTGGSIKLDGYYDGTNYDLIAEDIGTAATPEPTSLLLAGLAAAPLALGRRRRG